MYTNFLRSGMWLTCFSALTLSLMVSGCGSATEGSPVEEQAPEGGLEALLGPRLLTADGEEVSIRELENKKVGIYFSAHWCPPCRIFTPKLVETYNTLQAGDKPFEIVFVSSDRSAEAMREYMEEFEMSWLALPFDSEQRDALAQRYGVRGIPTLVVVDADGQTLSRNARQEVAAHGAAAFDRW